MVSTATSPTGSVPTSFDGSPDRRDRRPAVQAAVLVGFLVVAQTAGLIGIPFTGRGADSWYDSLEKPPFNPPSWVFAPVWTILYAAIAVAGWLVWRHARSHERTVALRWWIVQLVLNAAWSPLFFGAQLPGWALVHISVLLVVIVLTTRDLGRVDRPAAVLFVPYLAWVSFATVLNASIVVLN